MPVGVIQVRLTGAEGFSTRMVQESDRDLQYQAEQLGFILFTSLADRVTCRIPRTGLPSQARNAVRERKEI